MALTTDRMLGMLAAGEDALQALEQAESLCRRELEIAQRGGDPLAGLENLALMVRVDFLLREAGTTLSTFQVERAFYSPTRLGINRRARLRLRRLRQNKKGDE